MSKKQQRLFKEDSTVKKVAYDFTLDSCVAVDAPIGTDPDTLIEQAKAKFVERILDNDITVVFENTFDGETGAYDQDWRVPESYSEQMQQELEPIDEP